MGSVVVLAFVSTVDLLQWIYVMYDEEVGQKR